MASTVDLGRVVGATGAKGDKGATGEKGATGPAGPKGADGTKIYTQTSAPTGVATGTVWINI
ncbi:hypothetical protein [Blautia stercoris]